MFDGELRLKGEQSFIHEHVLNNPNCAKNYNDSRFKILSKVRNRYYLSVLESIYIKTNSSQKFVNNKKFII